MENMEKLVGELKKHITFKDTADVGDIVLIAAHEPQMLIYGLVMNIDRDTTKRDEWWQVSLHLLSIPPQSVTWTLRTEQLTGQEIFTMGGESRFIKAIDIPKPQVDFPEPDTQKTSAAKKNFLHIVK